MTHAESQDLLLDLAYGELPPLRAVELEAHLAGCADCQREKTALDEARRLAAPLREVEEPPLGFDDRILAAARAQAQLEHEGNIGEVIEVQGSVRPLGLEAAQVDAHAQVARREEKRRPRWMVRVALGGSVAAAAALALVMSTSLQQKHEVDRAAQLAADKTFEIRIQPAPMPQAAGEAVRDAKKEEAAHARAAPDVGERRQEELAAREAAPKRQPGEARMAKKKAAPEEVGGLGALGGAMGGSGGDALDAVASREPGRPPPSAAPPSAAPPSAAPPSAAPSQDRAHVDSATPTSAATTSTSPSPPAAAAQNRAQVASATPPSAAPPSAAPLPPAAAMRNRAQVASATPTAAAAAPAAKALAPLPTSAAELEQQAQEARHGGAYPLAATLYRKAADLRRAEAAQGNEGAWDLAHAVECLAAAGRFDEARDVRDQLGKLFPAESGAFAAAGRVLR